MRRGYKTEGVVTFLWLWCQQGFICLEDVCVPLAWFLFRKTKEARTYVGGKLILIV